MRYFFVSAFTNGRFISKAFKWDDFPIESDLVATLKKQFETIDDPVIVNLVEWSESDFSTYKTVK